MLQVYAPFFFLRRLTELFSSLDALKNNIIPLLLTGNNFINFYVHQNYYNYYISTSNYIPCYSKRKTRRFRKTITKILVIRCWWLRRVLVPGMFKENLIHEPLEHLFGELNILSPFLLHAGTFLFHLVFPIM